MPPIPILDPKRTQLYPVLRLVDRRRIDAKEIRLLALILIKPSREHGHAAFIAEVPMDVFAVELIVGEVVEGFGGGEFEVVGWVGDGEGCEARFYTDCAVTSVEVSE